MVSEKVTVKNPSGLHLRPAGILCKEAIKYKSVHPFSFPQYYSQRKKRIKRFGSLHKKRK